MLEIPSPYSRPSSTNAFGWKPGTCLSHGSRPEYEGSMWPVNMRLGAPPAPARAPAVRAATPVRPAAPPRLPLHLQAHVQERVAHELRHRLLGAREARRPDRL